MEKFLDFFTWEKLVSIALFFLKPLIILVVCRILIALLSKAADKVLNKTKLDDGIKGFAKSAMKILLWILAIIFAADALKIQTSSLVALLSVVSLALSLSVQNILTNIFSGITVLMSKPFVVGDVVEIGGYSGTVKAITLLRTTINTFDNKVELIPNGDIAAQKIINYSKEPLRRVDLKFTVSYDAQTADVKNAIMSVITADERIKTDEEHLPFVRLSDFKSNDIEYTVRVWVDNANYWDVYFDMLENVRETFNQNGIEFSYPHTIVHMAKD